MAYKKSNRKNKRFQTKVNGKTIHFGDPNSSIRPSTKKGDRYCARSYSIKDKNGKPTRNNKTSANYHSRKVWKCKGKRSIR